MTTIPEDEAVRPFIEDANFAYVESTGLRSRQEDYCLFQLYSRAFGPRLLAVLADGMGGHAGGAEASRMGVESFVSNFDSRTKSLPIAEVFTAVVEQVNSAIASAQADHPEFADMGCTLVGLYLHGRQYQWVSVGDSPLFLYRGGVLRRINADHSMAPVIAEAVEQGKLSLEEAQDHPSKNALRSAVMGRPIELIDLSGQKVLEEGDVLILASDGVLTLTLSEMEDVLVESPRHARIQAERLLAAVLAKEKPRQDNTTIMVIAPGACLFSPEMVAKYPVVEISAPDEGEAAPLAKRPRGRGQLMAALLVAVALPLLLVSIWLVMNGRVSFDHIRDWIDGERSSVVPLNTGSAVRVHIKVPEAIVPQGTGATTPAPSDPFPVPAQPAPERSKPL